MPTYVSLINWTKQGIQNVKDTTKRLQEGLALFEQMGIKMLNFYWTSGRYDGIAISEDDDETASAATLALSLQGNVRTETLRACTAEDMERILAKMP